MGSPASSRRSRSSRPKPREPPPRPSWTSPRAPPYSALRPSAEGDALQQRLAAVAERFEVFERKEAVIGAHNRLALPCYKMLPIFVVGPSENVYSHYMFIGPTEKKRKQVRQPDDKDRNWDIVMGYVLVGLNFFMQTILLYLIYEEILVGNVEWRNGIIKLSKGNGNGLLAASAGESCNDGGSLCFFEEGQYS